MIKFVISVAIAVATQAAAVRAQVPHTFSPGQPARSSEVNENFEALDTRLISAESAIADVSSYASRGTGLALVDASQQVIGEVVSLSSPVPTLDNIPPNEVSPIGNGLTNGVVLAHFEIGGSVEPFYLYIYSRMGTPYPIAEVENIFYTGAGCTGTAYVRRPQWSWPLGLPFSMDSITRELYVSTAAAYAGVPSVASRLQHDTSQCLSQSSLPANWDYFPVTDVIDLGTTYPQPWAIAPH